MVAEPCRRVLAQALESASMVAASPVLGAETEFGSWPPPRRWLLQTLKLAHLGPFPYS